MRSDRHKNKKKRIFGGKVKDGIEKNLDKVEEAVDKIEGAADRIKKGEEKVEDAVNAIGRKFVASGPEDKGLDLPTGLIALSGRAKDMFDHMKYISTIAAKAVSAFQTGGIGLILGGLMIIGLDVVLLELVRIAGYFIVTEMLHLAVMVFSFYLIFRGICPLRERTIAYYSIFIVSIMCMFVSAAQTVLTAVNIFRSMGDQAYVDFFTVFLWYVSLLGVLLIYVLLSSSESVPAMKMGTRGKLDLSGDCRIKPYMIMMITLVLMPFMKTLMLPLTIIFTLVLAMVFLWPQAALCSWIGEAHDRITAAPTAVRRDVNGDADKKEVDAEEFDAMFDFPQTEEEDEEKKDFPGEPLKEDMGKTIVVSRKK